MTDPQITQVGDDGRRMPEREPGVELDAVRSSRTGSVPVFLKKPVQRIVVYLNWVGRAGRRFHLMLRSLGDPDIQVDDVCDRWLGV